MLYMTQASSKQILLFVINKNQLLLIKVRKNGIVKIILSDVIVILIVNFLGEYFSVVYSLIS